MVLKSIQKPNIFVWRLIDVTSLIIVALFILRRFLKYKTRRYNAVTRNKSTAIFTINALWIIGNELEFRCGAKYY